MQDHPTASHKELSSARRRTRRHASVGVELQEGTEDTEMSLNPQKKRMNVVQNVWHRLPAEYLKHCIGAVLNIS